MEEYREQPSAADYRRIITTYEAELARLTKLLELKTGQALEKPQEMWLQVDRVCVALEYAREKVSYLNSKNEKTAE